MAEPALTKAFVVGHPIAHSRSPLIHGYWLETLGIAGSYERIDVAPDEIAAFVRQLPSSGFAGGNVTIPHKERVCVLVDDLAAEARLIGAVNTIVNTDGELVGYNTDYVAVAALLESHGVDPALPVAVRGSGGMANAVVAALADHGMTGTVVARNHETGPALATRYGWDYSAEVPAEAKLLVNVTPLGMFGDREADQAFTDAEITAAEVVFDVVAYPVETPLIRAAQRLGVPTINGGEVGALQAAEPVPLYTGVTPTPEQVEAAEAFANS